MVVILARPQCVQLTYLGSRGSREPWRHITVNHRCHDGLSAVYSGTDKRKHKSSTLLAFVRGIPR